MSFEQYTKIYDGGTEGITLRPKGESAALSFRLTPKTDTRYRLFTVGETEQFYMWKDEPDGLFLYRSLTDALDTAHAIRDRYCLNLSCKKYEDYLKRVYKKVMWPPRLSYLSMNPIPTLWETGITVSAENLSFSRNGYLRMRVDVRLKKDGVDPRSVAAEPDLRIVIPFPEGSYAALRLAEKLEIPKDAAHVAVFVEGVGYKGKCYVEQPFLSADGQNLLTAFSESVADRERFDWVGQYISRKEWPEFRVRLNNKVIYTGEIFERCHRHSEWEINLPAHLLKEENTVSYELISDYHDPLPYTLYEIGVIEQPAAPLSLLAVSEAAPAGGKARILVRTEQTNLRVTVTPLSGALSGTHECLFREKGLHGILLDCTEPATHAAFHLDYDGGSIDGEVARIVLREDDGVVTGTGDMIYVHGDPESMEEYLSWYLSNHVGDLVTIRPTYRWSGTRTLIPETWRKFRRLMNELGLKYVLMRDGREVQGLSTQPSAEELRGKGFYGIQMHERDGAQYYWGLHRADTHTTEMAMDLHHFAYLEDPAHTGSQYSSSNYVYNGAVMNMYADRDMPADYRLAHEKSVASLRRMRRADDTRHTGPSCMFKYMKEAGFSWLGAETMYSTMEPLMGFLRGAAKEYGMKTYGVHHAVQWSSTPHKSPARYRRFRLALYASYLLGATDVNTEEGLWHLEEYYEHHHRFGEACLAHLKEQQDFYRYVSTHSRTGRYVSPVGLLHGRDDGITFFAPNKAWGLFDTRTVAEDSWELIKTIYPKANPARAVYRHGCPEDVPQGYHSGTPYGSPDAVPAEAKAATWSDYRALVFLGYNRCEEADARKMRNYVKKGGKLLLTRAHLTVTSGVADIESGALAFEPNAMNLANGTPVFAQSTVNGIPLSVCTNADTPDEVLAYTDDGLPLVSVYRIGSGEIILFNTKEYPAHPAIRSLYEEELKRVFTVCTAEEAVYAETGDDVLFTVYEQEDFTHHVYFLAADWYRDPTLMRHAVLRLGKRRYDVSLPFGVMLKCVTNGRVAAFADDENGEVLAVTNIGIRVQGTGTVTFTVLKDGAEWKETVDFSENPVQEIAIG